MVLELEKAIGVVVGLMAFEFASRAALHLSIVAAVFGHMLR